MSLFQTIRAGGINQQALFLSVSALTGAATIVSCRRGDDAYTANLGGQQSSSVALPLLFSGLRNDRAKHDFNFHLHKRATGNNGNNIEPMILATSPMTTHAGVNSLMEKRRGWWKFHCWPYQHTSGDEKSKTTWFQRISKSIFVITRGVEIVIRLSPLLFLAPTAVFVSSANSLVEWMVRQPRKYGILSTCGESSSVDNDYLFVSQFEMARMTSAYPGETWASNLAWRYTLHTLQSLGPAFCKLGQW